MCNLYRMNRGQAEILACTRAMRDTTGNIPPLPGIFPDYKAPIVSNAPDGTRELTMVRWGHAIVTSCADAGRNKAGPPGSRRRD